MVQLETLPIQDVFYNSPLLFMFTIVETHLGIFVACLPTNRPLLISFRDKIVGASGIASRTSKIKSTTDGWRSTDTADTLSKARTHRGDLERHDGRFYPLSDIDYSSKSRTDARHGDYDVSSPSEVHLKDVV
jgi:hypothetical protein